LREPFEPGIRADGQRDIDARVRLERAIDLLGGLGCDNGLRALLGTDGDPDAVAACETAGCREQSREQQVVRGRIREQHPAGCALEEMGKGGDAISAGEAQLGSAVATLENRRGARDGRGVRALRP